MDFFWRLFLLSGSIEAYLGFREACLCSGVKCETAEFFTCAVKSEAM